MISCPIIRYMDQVLSFVFDLTANSQSFKYRDFYQENHSRHIIKGHWTVIVSNSQYQLKIVENAFSPRGNVLHAF